VSTHVHYISFFVSTSSGGNRKHFIRSLRCSVWHAQVDLLKTCNVVHADISGSNCCVDGHVVRLVDAWLRFGPLSTGPLWHWMFSWQMQSTWNYMKNIEEHWRTLKNIEEHWRTWPNIFIEYYFFATNSIEAELVANSWAVPWPWVSRVILKLSCCLTT